MRSLLFVKFEERPSFELWMSITMRFLEIGKYKILILRIVKKNLSDKLHLNDKIDKQYQYF